VIGTALDKQLNALKSQAFEVTDVLTDGEGGVAALTPDLNSKGIRVNPAGPALPETTPARGRSSQEGSWTSNEISG